MNFKGNKNRGHLSVSARLEDYFMDENTSPLQIGMRIPPFICQAYFFLNKSLATLKLLCRIFL
jgi:hypothetical protein